MFENLHKTGIKFYSASGDDIPLTEYINVFHGWIQHGMLDDVLVDVADYSHVPSGPGIMLIAHEGNFAMDETGGRRGALYYSKREIQGEELEDRLLVVLRRCLAACRLLEESEEFRDRLSFDYGAMEIFANDRLHAPNDDRTREAFEPVLDSFLKRIYPDTGYEVEYNDTDPRERFGVRISMQDRVATAADFLARL